MVRPSSRSLRLAVTLAFAFAARTTSTLPATDLESSISIDGSTGGKTGSAGGAFSRASSVQPRPRPTFLIVQWGTPDYLGRYAEFIDRNRKYARRHGYGYYLSTVTYEAQLGTLSKHWGKVLAVRDALDRPINATGAGATTGAAGAFNTAAGSRVGSRAGYDYILWLDADCLVAEQAQRLDPFVGLDDRLSRVGECTIRDDSNSDSAQRASTGQREGQHQGHDDNVRYEPCPLPHSELGHAWDLVITDANIAGRFHVNNAAFLLRNSEWSRALLKTWWAQSPSQSHHAQDQDQDQRGRPRAPQADWFSFDQGAFWNALLLTEFPRSYDDRCAAGNIPFDARALTQCINSWLDEAGAPFRRRRFEHSLLVDPYRHLENGGGGDGGASDTAHIRGLHFWSSMSVSVRSCLFHSCGFEDHFEPGDFIVQTRHSGEAKCGRPCWSGTLMARFPSTSSAPSGSLGRVDDGVIGSVHPGLRPNAARSALEDEVNCQLVDVPGPLAHWPGPPFNVHPLGGTRRVVFEAELAAQARPPGSPLGPPEVPVCAQGPNQVCRLDDIDRTQGASAGMAYTAARARPRDDRQREGGTHTGVHVAVQLRRRFLCAASGRSGHETRSVMVRLGEGDDAGRVGAAFCGYKWSLSTDNLPSSYETCLAAFRDAAVTGDGSVNGHTNGHTNGTGSSRTHEPLTGPIVLEEEFRYPQRIYDDLDHGPNGAISGNANGTGRLLRTSIVIGHEECGLDASIALWLPGLDAPAHELDQAVGAAAGAFAARYRVPSGQVVAFLNQEVGR